MSARPAEGGSRGVVYGVAAYAMWGVFPLFWPLLRPATATEILAHRVVWSLVFLAAVVTARREWATIGRLDRKAIASLGVAALLVGANWGAYIWGVNHRHVVETSLGYFVNPLVTVLLGVVVLREKLRRAQAFALALGACAVMGLAIDYGRPPWLSLFLAVTFAGYGLVKKRAAVPALASLTVETAWLALPAAAYAGSLQAGGTAAFAHVSRAHDALFVLSGAITCVPLLCFGAAANRVPLSTLGMLQYLSPTLQLACGVLVLHEPMPPARLAGFLLVWVGLVVLAADAARQRAAARADALMARHNR